MKLRRAFGAWLMAVASIGGILHPVDARAAESPGAPFPPLAGESSELFRDLVTMEAALEGVDRRTLGAPPGEQEQCAWLPGAPCATGGTAPGGLLSHTSEAVYTYYRRTGDLDGDGYQDVLARTVRTAMYDDYTAPGDYYYNFTLEALRGSDGSTLWKRNYDKVDGWTFALSARVGQRARHGVLVYSVNERVRGIEITALDGTGKKLWTSKVNQNATSVAQLDALPGDATDVLVGVENQARGPVDAERLVGHVAEAHAIDGRDGVIAVHAERETRIGRPLEVLAAPDLDGDGLDDYVFVDEWDKWDGAVSSSGPGTVVARRGTDGTRLWESATITTAGDPNLYPVGDLTGDGIADVAVASQIESYELDSRNLLLHMFDGATGDGLWSGNGWYAMNGKDIDKDGLHDVVIALPFREGPDVGMRVEARNGKGEVIYSRERILENKDNDTYDYIYVALYAPGDLNGDRHPDLLIAQYADNMYGDYTYEKFVFDGKTGDPRNIPLGVTPAWDRLSPGRSGLVKYTRMDDYSISVGAPWSRGRTPRFTAIVRTTSLGYFGLFSTAGRYAPTGCGNLLVSIEAYDYLGGPSAAVMFDTGTGRVLWRHGHTTGLSAYARITPPLDC